MDKNNSEDVTTADVLAEVERRRAMAKAESNERQHKVVVFVDRFVFLLSKHWLIVFNALVLLYVGLPVLAPVLMHLGATRPAMILYTIYRPLCHQMPHRSWFRKTGSRRRKAIRKTRRRIGRRRVRRGRIGKHFKALPMPRTL